MVLTEQGRGEKAYCRDYRTVKDTKVQAFDCFMEWMVEET